MDDRHSVFTVSVDSDNPAVVHVGGELDLATAPDLSCVLQTRDGDVALDCSGLTFIDASGLSAVMEAQASCRARGVRFMVLDPSPALVRLVQLLQLDSVLPLCSRDRRLLERDRDQA